MPFYVRSTRAQNDAPQRQKQMQDLYLFINYFFIHADSSRGYLGRSMEMLLLGWSAGERGFGGWEVVVVGDWE